MIRHFFVRLFYGLLFALPLMLLTYALAQAGTTPQEQPPQDPQTPACASCHESFQKSWETSAHGQAVTDPAFQKAWEAKGSPVECLSCHVTGYDAETHTWEADGITCQACHNTSKANHPKEPMAADRSSQLCGECHSETYFEWQVSAHREKGLDCVGCHDPHGTTLKAEDAANQCASCHRERASNFAHSAHSQQGLDCADCHLAQLDDPSGEGHARLDHSFSVRLSTCNRCHAYDMHDPANVHPENPTPMPPDAMAAVESLSVVSDPGPVSPVGFAMLSGVFGLAMGVIVSPWLERRGGKPKRTPETKPAVEPPSQDQDKEGKGQ